MISEKKPGTYAPLRGELTDNPPIANRVVLLTDDESDEDRRKSQEAKQRTSQQQPKPIINRIFESSSSSKLNDPDKTYCSVAEAADRKPSSEPLYNTDDLISNKNSKSLRDTVGFPSDDEDDEPCSQLSQKLSEMKMIEKRKTPKKKTATLADTVVGNFSDDSDGEVPVESRKLADTIVKSFSSDDEYEMPPQSPPQKTKRANHFPISLPDTAIGFPESSDTLPPEVEEEESQESEYDEEVISVLDSEDEEPLNDDDHPPILESNGSFENVSSIGRSSERRTEWSDTTNNRFFNNPPEVSNLQLIVSHSFLRKCKEPPMVDIPEEIGNVSADRFKSIYEDVDGVESFGDDIEIPETDMSEEQNDEENAGDELQGENQNDVQEEAVNIQPEVPGVGDEIEDQEVDSEPQTPSIETEVESNEIVASERTNNTPVLTSSSDYTLTQSQSQTFIGNINFSAKININLKISLRDSRRSSTSESESSSSSSDPPTPPPKKTSRPAKETPRAATPKSTVKVTPKSTVKATPKSTTEVTPKKSKKPDSTIKEKQVAAPRSGNKNTAVSTSRASPFNNPLLAFQTPEKPDEPVIDDGLQAILNEVYGETWKTPQLLKSCKSKSVRQDLRKSIQAHNFEACKNFILISFALFSNNIFLLLVVKNLPNDFESTRITTSSSDESPKVQKPKDSGKKKDVTPSINSKFKMPVSSVKTPRQAKVKAKQQIEEFESESESDDLDSEEFSPNETWNASSDDDAEEVERIRRRTIARESRRDEEFEMVFLAAPVEEKRKTLDALLEQFEYKKPPSMAGTETPHKKSKRKLFTHTHYDDDFVADTAEDDKEKENEKPEIVFPILPIYKKLQDVKDSAKKFEPSPVVKKTPKAKLQTPTSMAKALAKAGPLKENNFGTYSFLKSLDAEVNPILCDPEALQFCKTFKSKKHELTDRLFKLYNDRVFDGKLSGVPVKWNKKLLNTAGRCNNSRRINVRQSMLELSDKVLTSADRLRCTLIHEMCHAATWILQGENGHGATWKGWAAKANAKFPELPKINVRHNYIIEYRYTYQCVDCKAKYQAHSKSKKVENIRCRVCRGTIELFLNKKNKEGDVVMTPVSKDVKGFPKFVKINYKEVKRPNMTHKEVMQVLSQRFAGLSVEQKQNL